MQEQQLPSGDRIVELQYWTRLWRVNASSKSRPRQRKRDRTLTTILVLVRCVPQSPRLTLSFALCT